MSTRTAEMVLSKKHFAASLTILLVERSAETRAKHSAGLAGLGYNVIVASRLEEARLALESWTDLFPAATAAGIPLMIISHDQSVENRVLCLEQVAADFMVKPVDIRELSL